MTRWFRMYGEAMRHPKVARLSDKEFRLWVRLLGVASENEGIIPPLDDLKYVLNTRLDHLLTGVERLISIGLIDRLEHGYVPHNWKKYQYKSDTSKERVAKHRAKCNVTVTPPETDTDTEKKEDSSLRSESKKERVTGTRLPEAWEPSEDSEFALPKLPPSAAEEIKKFRDYWLAVPGAKGRKLDWQRTWNNWWRNVEHRQPRNVVPLIRHGPVRETPRETMERIMKQMENGDDVGLFESSNLPLVSLQR